MSDILEQIVERKRARLEEAKRRFPQDQLLSELPTVIGGGRFTSALRRDAVNVIAEIKRRSPSRGVIRENFDPLSIAINYTANGAAAISCLTEEDFFGGSIDHLRRVRDVTPLPLLRKDFVLDELVEVHDRVDIEKALCYDVRMLGVNNRNLRTLETSLQTSFNLVAGLPKEVTLVSESGIQTREDIERLRAAGFHAVLIGEELMRAEDEGKALKALLAGPR